MKTKEVWFVRFQSNVRGKSLIHDEEFDSQFSAEKWYSESDFYKQGISLTMYQGYKLCPES